ncbi:hypothetical protein KRR55_07380 [Paeniglutamicibacter sp. ABSL32-1]|uniref:hypothetical protein n=1 Tax=Paeniglutamicibacter quisquiliarum TaxID=2849498 RepID=UPI001C2D002D|nr:hypothetical protein [Paeniglutamicibacter quisquiliarum]MBV1778929.1 hypothetical protein [Paeniglutamicibacter quisquiliarum]
MSSKVQLSWDSMVTGETLGVFRSTFDAEHTREFAHIVDPQQQVYTDGTAPSLAYDTLHAVKDFIELPQGTVHSKESVEFHAPALVDQPATVLVLVADKSVRRGRKNFTLECRVFTGSHHVISAFKSFVVPGKTEEPDSSTSRSFDFGLFTAGTNPGQAGPKRQVETVEFVVVQSLLDEFGRVTATDGPIHTDSRIATEQFGGTILQGMYLFELASQTMTRFSSPSQWLSSGKLAAKIVGSSITGETVTIIPTAHRVTNGDTVHVHCSFEARTSSGSTVFVAEAVGPLTAKKYLKELAS